MKYIFGTCHIQKDKKYLHSLEMTLKNPAKKLNSMVRDNQKKGNLANICLTGLGGELDVFSVKTKSKEVVGRILKPNLDYLDSINISSLTANLALPGCEYNSDKFNWLFYSEDKLFTMHNPSVIMTMYSDLNPVLIGYIGKNLEFSEDNLVLNFLASKKS
jgi:hypothetical protein